MAECPTPHQSAAQSQCPQRCATLTRHVSLSVSTCRSLTSTCAHELLRCMFGASQARAFRAFQCMFSALFYLLIQPSHMCSVVTMDRMNRRISHTSVERPTYSLPLSLPVRQCRDSCRIEFELPRAYSRPSSILYTYIKLLSFETEDVMMAVVIHLPLADR